MSQMVTRKGPVGDDKEKAQTDSPVKEMKKKMAANAEKEKQASEKNTEKEKEKNAEKHPEKADKNADKSSDKKDKVEKNSDKKDKPGEKEKDKVEKSAEKKNEAPTEKPKEDKSAKPDKPTSDEKEKEKKRAPDTPKPKQNGSRANGLPSETQNGGDHSDATVSSDEEMVIDHERDDMFPELAYEDSDGEFEPPTPEGLPSRSFTRRSQAKAARTPETPRPASDKRADGVDESKESKVLKLKDDTQVTDRKLRSSDSPKPESKKPEKVSEKKAEKEKETVKEADTAKKEDKPSPKKKDLEVPEETEDENVDKATVETIIDLDADEEPSKEAERSKVDTNYSRSRVKVSPYRRAKLADQTSSSNMANYTGNNTTMEMDITESSTLITEESPSMDSSYLSGLRNIRGRRSYKPLSEMAVKNISVNRSVHSTSVSTVSEQLPRPTAPVVGRKRKPEGDSVQTGNEAPGPETEVRGKRARLLGKLARSFRSMASTPLPARRNAEIVGINTDLPQTAPFTYSETFDPESLKVTSTPVSTPPAKLNTPPTNNPTPEHERDPKWCVLM